MTQLGKAGFILVAGGLGERLGYNGTKVRENESRLFSFMFFPSSHCFNFACCLRSRIDWIAH